MPLTSFRLQWWLSWLALVCLGTLAYASTPRWTTGPPYFYVTGTNVVWYTNSPLYFTDPGDLSPYVDHAAADALVAAAAGVWNVPTSMITLAQGGTLAEQAGSSNVYMGSNGLVYPADVASTNYAAIQIAVLYDRDGSVTDLLLGSGASDPSGCLDHGVTESVDSIAPSGLIQHAVLILNGRCTGPAPEMQLQLRYQLQRAFGRVLGLGWSQLNDNVFMGTPQPTYDQALHWPIMHPVDIICGPYTYQCLPEPFTLRDDDIASLVFLYLVDSSVPPGKQKSLTRASEFSGNLRFPTREGIGGVNIVLRRNSVPQQVLEDFEDVSAMSGVYAQQIGGNPITPKPSTLAGSFGEVYPYYDVAGYYNFVYIPLPDGQGGQDILLHTEPINPLYTGEYALGPYTLSTVNPAGDPVSWRANYVVPFWTYYYEPPVGNTPGTCATSDGTEGAPAPIANPATASGWWTGVLCGGGNSSPWSFAHTSWLSIPVRANRSFTAEMTALDATGAATGNKLRPVLGLWHASDAQHTAPSVAAAPIAFNSAVLGLTSLSAHTVSADTFRLALSSETGDGRPDYSYQARLFYADTVTPTSGVAGDHMTLTGMGFRPGNTVTVGGVAASVASWTATSIVATIPRLAAVPPGGSTSADIAVTDLSTRGTTVMAGALQYTYTAPTYMLQLVSAPAAAQVVNLAASPGFAVKVLDADGITPLAGASVVFAAVTGSVSWSACGSATCTVLTDATGLASIGVTPLSPGALTLQAASQGQTLQTSFQAAPLVRAASITPATQYLAAGAAASWTATAAFQQQGFAAAQAPVVWTAAPCGMTITGAQTATGTAGTAQATIYAGPFAAGAQASGTACAWGTVCASFSVIAVDGSQLTVVVTAGGAQTLSGTATFAPVLVQITDAAGDPVAGAAVQISQTVRQWTQPCPTLGRCPISPVTRTAQTTGLSSLDGSLSIAPLDPGGPALVDLVITAGTQGYAALTLQRTP